MPEHVHPYSQKASQIYDLLVGGDEVASIIAEDCEPFVEGKRVLDVGTGTGSIVSRWSHLAVSVTAIDSSQAMLEVAREKIDPRQVDLQLADFTRDLTRLGTFDVAISNRGSLAYADSVDEMRLALTNIFNILEDHGVLVVEMFCYSAYERMANEPDVFFKIADLEGTMSAKLCDDSLIYTTTLDRSPVGSIQFTEKVVFLPLDELISVFSQAGFRYDNEESLVSQGEEAFDWLVFIKDLGN